MHPGKTTQPEQVCVGVCNRALLCARSEYFATMLHGAFAEGQSTHLSEVHLEGVDAGVLSTALRWAYTDEIDPDATPEHLLQVCVHARWCDTDVSWLSGCLGSIET